MIQIQFAPLKVSDIHLLLGWFLEPHVKEYWKDSLTDQELIEKYSSYSNAEDIVPFIILIDNKSVGYIQAYPADKVGDGWWPNETSGTYGFDLFIGDATMTGKGHGPNVLQSFLSYFEKFHLVKKWVVDVSPNNTKAIKCFSKAGFKTDGLMNTPDGPALLMVALRHTKVRHLSDFLATEFSTDLYSDTFGTSDPIKIQEIIYKHIPNYFGTVSECLFTATSIGFVFGFKTTTHRQIVLKIYPKKFTQETLSRIHFIQNRMHQANYPAPAILSEIIQVCPKLFGIILDYVPGHRADGHDPLIRKELACYLAEFSKIVKKEPFLEVKNPFQSKPRNRLWPTPHKSTIRLKETSKGAGFIRDRAITARKIIFAHDLPKQLAHLDWGIKNALFSGKRLVAILDWDSLGVMSEAEMVGQATAQFTADWEIPTKLTPSGDEAWSFIQEYEEYREQKFNKKEIEVVSASADFLISLIARYEYSEGVKSENSFLHLLRSLGNRPFIEI